MTDLARPQSKLREKISETRENIADVGHLASETAQDKFHELKDRASEKYDEGKEKLHELEATFEQKVRESPIKSILIAAGVGLALGYLWRRS